MKNNQFAQIKISVFQQQKELEKIGMITNDFFEQDFWVNLRTFYEHCFPESYSKTTKNQKIADILVTDLQDLSIVLQEQRVFTGEMFYNAALQLLRFEVDSEFSLTKPFYFMDQEQLSYLAIKEFNNEALLEAIYLLLTTHTKRGQTYLDDLAARGFFKDYFVNKKPHLVFFNGKAQPVFDSTKIIREVVYVESPLDTDQDGQRDLLEATIFRPAETNQGLRMAALYTANPYYKGIQDIRLDLHEVEVDLVIKSSSSQTAENLGFNGDNSEERKNLPKERIPAAQTEKAESMGTESGSYSLNDYLLVRGFANIYAGGIGTRHSDGIRTCGSKEETISTVAVIEWLTGVRKAYTNKIDNVEIKAWWCNGNVAMTGKSYLGTLATAAATTGVAGLKTIISEAAISSWYDYYRENGLVVAPVDCQGEDTDVLAKLCFSRKKDAADYAKAKDIFAEKLQELKKEQDRESGNYSAFWEERNYLKDIQKIKCDIIMVHGLNDWNVKPRHVGALWQALRKVSVTKKIFLHQGKHVYINNLYSIDFTDMMNLWLSHKLYAVDNQADTVIPNVMIQDNAVSEDWHVYSDWNDLKTPRQSFYLTAKFLSEQACSSTEIQTFQDKGVRLFRQASKDAKHWEQEFLQEKSLYQDNRLIFKTRKFEQEQIIDGTIQVTLNMAVDQPAGQLSMMVVDFGRAKRLKENADVLAAKGQELGYQWKKEDLKEFILEKEASFFKVITKGHMNFQNRLSNVRNETIKPHQFYSMTLSLQPTYYRLLSGRKLGLVVYATDMGMTIRPNIEAEYQIDLNGSHIDVPFL